MDLFGALNRQGITVVLITHEMRCRQACPAPASFPRRDIVEDVLQPLSGPASAPSPHAEAVP